MRINLTKKDIINSIYMQLGFSKKISENLLEDFLSIILDELIRKKKVKIANITSIIGSIFISYFSSFSFIL